MNRQTKSYIIDQVHISALAHGMERISEKINVPHLRLLDDLAERNGSNLSLRSALQIIEVCLDYGPEQARQAARNAIEAIAALREVEK